MGACLMANLSVNLRLTSQLVIRESDGATLLLVAAYVVGSRNVMPMLMMVVEPTDDE